MSGIYIPYMEMPSENEEIGIVIRPDGSIHYQFDLKCKTIATAIPVPDHGRLIDADADPNNYTTAWECHCSEYGNQTVMATEALYDFPTIIQADPAEEG